MPEEEPRQIVVWEREWPQVRRFFRSCIDGTKHTYSSLIRARELGKESFEHQKRMLNDFAQASKKELIKVRENYPEFILAGAGAVTALATRRVTKTGFGTFRNFCLGALFSGALLFPQGFVTMLIRPGEWFSHNYDKALLSRYGVKPDWELFKDIAKSADEVVEVAKKEIETVAENIENVAEAVGQEVVRSGEHINNAIEHPITPTSEDKQ
ncbi:hypothetical protein AKO1_001848 [Acrasis kona]|uniref:MICOS complex subunit n=1 Tax=Acrasis kona TaxID=1008807 RepID=A0AAW2ZB49_9EUKA